MGLTLHADRGIRASCALIMLLAVACLVFGTVAQAHAVTFDPELVISDTNMDNYGSMSAAEIQAFLEAQTGILDTLVTTDYAGVEKPASTIVWEACQASRISPKVMLTMLQKEQSLLTRRTLSANTLSRAIGAGCPNGYTNKYPGFGQQMYNGARLLRSYGETNPSFPTFTPGMAKTIYEIDGMTEIYPKNLGTYKLYVYNPSIGVTLPYGDLVGRACSGNANFWLIFSKYFGDPLSDMTFTLRYEASSGGTLSGALSQTVNYGATGTPVTASPIAGYHFVGWSDGSTANPRTETGVKADKTVSATFAIDSPAVPRVVTPVVTPAIVKPKVIIKAPVAPTTMYKAKYKTVYGYLKPRHAKGSTSVVRIYRYKKNSKGVYVKYDYVRAKLSNYSTYSKYTKSLAFPSKGKWRIRAYVPADTKHAATWSSYDYVTVK